MARILQRHKDLQASNGDTDTVEGRGTEEAPMPIAPDMGREHNNDNDTHNVGMEMEVDTDDASMQVLT